MARKATTKSIKELNLEDDFLFAKLMQNKEICRKVLEKILKVSIKKVSAPITQRTIDLILEGKGIRLDVYINDEQGTIYNIEMQRGKKKELPKRSRYYQGNIDLDLIVSGQPYTKLKKTFVIFICTFDPFNEGRHIYTFENFCIENKALSLGDETIKVFLNTKGTMDDVDEDVQEFLEYIENSTDEFVKNVKSDLVKEIHVEVTRIKESKELEVEYMTLYMRDLENREEGMAEGIIEMGLEFKLPVEEILLRLQEKLKISSEEAEEYMKMFSKQQV